MRNTTTVRRVKITSLEQLRQLASGEEDLEHRAALKLRSAQQQAHLL